MGGSKSAGPSPTSPIGSAAAAAAFTSAKSLEKRPNLRVVPPKQDEDARKNVREVTSSDTLSRSSSRRSSNDTSLNDLMIAKVNPASMAQPQTQTQTQTQPQYRLWFRKKSGGPATSLIVQPGELVDDVKTRILQKYPTSLQQRIDPADLVLTVPKSSGIRLELQPDELVTQVIDEYFNGNMRMSDALEIGPPVAFWNSSQWGGGSSSSANNSVCGHTPVSQAPGLFSNNTTPTITTPGTGNNSQIDSRGSRSQLQRTRSFGQWTSSPPFMTGGANGPMGISNGPSAGGGNGGNAPTSNNGGGGGFPFPSSYGNYSSAYNNNNNNGTNGPATSPLTSGFSHGGTKPNTPSSETGRSPAQFSINHTPSVASMPSLGSAAASTVGGDSRGNSSVNIAVHNGDSEPETTVLLLPRPQPVTSKPLNRNSNAAALAAANAAASSSISNANGGETGVSSPKQTDHNGGAIASTHSGFYYDSIDYSKWKLTSKQDDLPKGTVVPQIKILIVEDNRINQQILERFLKKKNVQFEVAQTGREALDKWKTGEFHLILMDIQLPVMTGLEATQEIRRLEAVNGIGAFQQGSDDVDNAAVQPHDVIRKSAGGFRSPVIIVALTASSDSDDLTEALAAGCNDFLTKPVNFAWLERKIIEWGCMQALIDFEGWKSWNVEDAVAQQ